MLKSEPNTTMLHDFSETSLDRLLEELSQRSDTEIDSGAFFEFASKSLSCLSIDRIAVWSLVPPGSLIVNWPVQWTETEAQVETASGEALRDRQFPPGGASQAPSPLAGNPQVVRDVIESGNPRLIHPGSQNHQPSHNVDEPSGASGGGLAAMVSPWRGVGSQRGAIIVWIAQDSPVADPYAYLPLIAAVGEIVARFQTRRAMLCLQETLTQQLQIDTFASSLHACVDLKQTAYAIANDGRPLIDCDRLSVVLRLGSRWKVAAISGAEHVHRHSPSAQSLQSFCRCAIATGAPLWQDMKADNLPPQIADSMADYLDHSPASAIAVIPLSPPATEAGGFGPIIGALVIEHYQQEIASRDKKKILLIAKHCSIALDKAIRLDRVPGIRLGWWLANHRWSDMFNSRTVIGITAIVVAFLCLVCIPADIRIRAQGELMPSVRREVFAPRDAVITKVLIQHGQWVHHGQPLIELRSTDLELEIQQVDGELQQARKRLSVTQSERLQLPPGDADARNRQRRLTADEEQYQQQVTSLEARQEILRQHQKQLIVTAPIAGQVLTWNTQERLATRPIRSGEALLSVADTKGEWQAELKIPGRHAGRLINVHQAIPEGSRSDTTNVMIASSTAPGIWLSGRISKLSSRLEADAAGNAYLAAISRFTNDDETDRIPLVPGATTVARIGCGRGSLGESLFFELADAVRLWVPF